MPNNVQQWVRATPLVGEWVANLGSHTAQVYSSNLHRYWVESLSKRLPDIGSWVKEVKEQHKSDEVEVKRRWASDLEKFYKATPLAQQSRMVLTSAIKSFLSKFVELSKYDFKGWVTREELVRERKEKESLTPLTAEEVRRLVNEANTRDKAVILCQLSAGMGVAEFIQFAQEWSRYEDQIRSKQVPIKLSIVRPKTAVPYWTLLWDDAVEALHDLLQERERNFGRRMTKEDYLFVHITKDSPIEADNIQEAMSLLRDRTGLERNRRAEPGKKRVYRIRPHELRDTFKTFCENADVQDNISEFLMGHEVDDLGYNKFAQTKEGEERIRLALQKVRPQLNVITSRGVEQRKESYADQVIETWAAVKGMAEEELWKMLTYFSNKIPATAERRRKMMDELREMRFKAESAADIKEMRDEIVVQAMSKEELFPAVVMMAKSLDAPKDNKVVDRVVDETELDTYLQQGWTFISVVNSHKVVIRRLS